MYGSAFIIEERYPDKLLEVLKNIFEYNQHVVDERLKKVLKILKLHEARNRSEILGKSFIEIEEDFKKWKDISGKVRDIVKEV